MALRLSTGFRDKQLGVRTSQITNGNFDSDTTGWTAVDATLASVAGGVNSTNALEITETGGVNPGKAYQDFTTVVDRIYKLTYYFKKGTADQGRVLIGTTGDEDAIHDTGALTDAAWTAKTILFQATETTTRVTLQSDDATVGETSLFDELIMDEVMDGFRDLMRNCKIAVYTGSQPADADTAASGTLLVTITESGGANGLTFDDASSGSISKAASETFSQF